MMIGHKLLINSFEALAKSERLAHGYLFVGPEGVGKRLVALSFANFLENPPAGGGEFSARGGSAFGGDYDEKNPGILGDCLVIGLVDNSIGVDEARKVKRFLAQRPNRSAYRTVIIDKAEYLTNEAQNALLKITEEPPLSALLILVVQNPELLMDTLNSRLQKIYFSALSVNEVKDWLVSEHKVGTVEAERLAKESFGQPGLALRMFQDEKLIANLKLAREFLKLNRSSAKEFLKNLLEPENFNFADFLDALAMILARDYKIHYNLWHKVLELRRNISFFPLNPRLQLQSLLN